MVGLASLALPMERQQQLASLACCCLFFSYSFHHLTLMSTFQWRVGLEI